jgi:hypothetical protein
VFGQQTLRENPRCLLCRKAGEYLGPGVVAVKSICGKLIRIKLKDVGRLTKTAA